MTSICCVCNKIKQQGMWVAGEVSAEQEQLSHGYCPACYAKMLVDIHSFMGQQENRHPLSVPAAPAAGFVGACA